LPANDCRESKYYVGRATAVSLPDIAMQDVRMATANAKTLAKFVILKCRA